MGATHRIDFSLIIESADVGLEGTPIRVGSQINGSFLINAQVDDIDFRSTVGVYENAAFSGFITCEAPMGETGEILLGLGEITTVNEQLPGIPDGFTTVFARNQGGIGGDVGFDLTVAGVGLSLFDNDGLSLQSDSLIDALGSGLVGFEQSQGATQMLSITLRDSDEFYQSIGELTSFNLSVVPSPGPLMMTAVAALLIFGRRITRAA